MIPSLTSTPSCDTVCVAEEGGTNDGVYSRKIMYGEKYNIESSVFMAAYELAKQGIKPADIREKTADVVC